MKDKPPPDLRARNHPVSKGVSPVFLRSALYLALFSSLVFLLFAYYFDPTQTVRLFGSGLEALLLASSLYLISRGQMHLALSSLLWGSWLIVTGVLSIDGGVRGTLVISYPIVIILVGWLSGERSAIIMASLTSASIVALIAAGPDDTRILAALYGIVQIICIVFSTLLVIFFVRSNKQRLDEVEQLSKDLARQGAEARTTAADLDAAQSIARIGSWVYSFSNDRIAMSDETCRIFNLPAGSRGTRSAYLQTVHPDDLPSLAAAWDEALKGYPLFNEHRIEIKQKSHWICQRGKIEFDARGKPLRCLGSTQDITELKLYEDELRIAATAFEAREGMLITDAEQKILRINQAFTRVTGYGVDDVRGATPRLLKSGRHDAAFYSAMWIEINTTGAWAGEIWNRRKSGEIYPEWLTITAVKNNTGNVTHYVGTLTDISQRKAAEDEIRHLAFYDPLTRLANRRLLLDRLQHAQAASARSGQQGALLFIDLDNFKVLNDTQGHDKGDLLLQQVAHRLSACIREGDTAARFGGDEFVIMLGDLSTSAADSATQAETVGKKILAALSEPFALINQSHRTSASIGITLFNDHQSTAFELLKQADLAMYAAKAAGRNTLCFYTEQMQVQIRDPSANKN